MDLLCPAICVMSGQASPSILSSRLDAHTLVVRVQCNYCTAFVQFILRVSYSCNSFPPTVLTKLAGMSLGQLVMSTYKMMFYLLKLMFRLRACTEDIANFALFAEANSYLWMFWLELRRRNKQPLNSGDEFPNTNKSSSE